MRFTGEHSLSDADLTAAHVVRMVEGRHVDACGEELLAQGDQVRRAQIQRHAAGRAIHGLFGAQEHPHTTLAMHARPPQGRGAVSVNGDKTQQLLEAAQAFDLCDMQHGSQVSGFNAHQTSGIRSWSRWKPEMGGFGRYWDLEKVSQELGLPEVKPCLNQ